jgi:hypothetical protein
MITRLLSSGLQTEQVMPMDHSKRFALTSLWSFAPFLLLAPGIAWIWLDHGSWQWDQAWYANCSSRLYILLKSHGKGWLKAMLTIDGGHAPGLIWSGQFFVGLHPLFGGIERALLFGNLLFQAATVWIVYDMCRRLADGRKIVGAACALLVAAAPLFVGIGHGYFVENLQLLTVAWLWRLAVISPEISRPDLTITVALAFVLGMAAKVSTPLFAGPPLLLAALGTSGVLLPRPAMPRHYKRLTRAFLLTAMVLISYLTCAWYMRNFKYLLAYLKLPLTTAFWGSFDPFTTKVWRWLGFLRIFFLPRFMLYASLSAIVIAFLQVWRTRHFERYRESIALGGIASVALMLTIYSMAPNEDYRLALPVLPAVVVILAWALHKVPRPLVLIFCLVAMGSGFAVQGRALGIIPRSLNDPVYLQPLSADLTLSSELTALIRITAAPETDNRMQICAVQYSWLNCNLLSFHAAREKVLNGGFMPSYTTDGVWYGEADLDKALKTINTINPRFIISVREDLQPAPDFVNLVNLSFLAHLRADHRYKQVEFPSRLGIIVFKRVDDLTGG